MTDRTFQNIIYTEADSPARWLPFGEEFIEEHMPVGTRVIFPNPPIEGLANPAAAIRHAINHPIDCEPLYAMLKPGMKITIAVDDISVPLPPMVLPDIRQVMLEIVLQLLADYGVDDIHIIIATAFHRRMSGPEVKRMVGAKIFGEYWPKKLYNLDVEDPEQMTHLGATELGEEVEINRRAVESDLVIYLNLNLVPMDGGHKSVAVGLSGYKSLRAHHNPDAIRKSDSYMDPYASELHNSVNRQGKIVQEHVNIFTIETIVNNRMYPKALDFFHKNEEQWSSADRAKFQAMKWGLSRMPRAARRKVLHSTPAPLELIGVYAGRTEAVHKLTIERCFDQYAVKVDGQADILVVGIPHISPYNVYSILNPVLVQCMALGYIHNMYRGKPVLKKGGTLIVTHPCYDEFHAGHHPSYIEFFNRLLPETRDAHVLQRRYEEEFAKNPNYIQMFRFGNAYHGAHAFYMWYWGENGRQHVGRVIAAGAESPHVPERLGWEWAPDVKTALEMAKESAPPSPDITMFHFPPIMICDVT